MSISLDNRTEWLEADGLGGFASGTTCGERSRRYHALLLTAANPPTGRMVLVNGFDAWVETPAGVFAISSQRYAPEVVHPDGATRLIDFRYDPWPQWTFGFPDGTSLVQEMFVPHETAACCLRWRFIGSAQATLTLRPFFSGRDYHSLHHENPAFRFEPQGQGGWLVWNPYDGVAKICALDNGQYIHNPQWYRNFLYVQEQERGLDCVEDLASPGLWQWDLSQEAVLIFAAEGHLDAILTAAGATGSASVSESAGGLPGGSVTRPNTGKASGTQTITSSILAMTVFQSLLINEQTRCAKFATPLHRAADAYLVCRGSGKTIIAGYPWFTDWGRDTFISLRGLCLATGRLEDAKHILLAWAATVSQGMLPNRFVDAGDKPEFNSVDASLWFVVAVHDFLDAAAHRKFEVTVADRGALQQAALAIVSGYSLGTRFGIRQDSDGLLATGVPGVQLTWMDAKVGDWVVTPRIGKPVEVQCLWLNALWIAGRIDPRWMTAFELGRTAFERRFWNIDQNCLFDVVDVDYQSGKTDAALRPNQVFAIGGLPLALLHGEKAASVLNVVESHLLTPLGLRTLAPGSPNYAQQCVGNPHQRDAAYHQGTVWPWLMGAFVEAWLRVRGGSAAAKTEARQRFLPPLVEHLNVAGLGHISEVTDAEPPFTPRGCPFQAWSLGEFLRLQLDVLCE